VLSSRRARPYILVFAAVAAVVALVAGALVVMLGRLESAADRGARSSLALHAGADLALAARLPLDQDSAERQDAQVRRALEASVPAALASTVIRSTSAEMPFGAPEDDRDALVLAGSDVQDQVDLVDGREATAAGEASLQADAAATLDLGIGSEITLGGRTHVVVGTWRVRDPRDPRWLSDDRITTGRASEIGPFVVPDPDWTNFAGARPRAQWVVVPDPETLTVADLEATMRSWPRLGLRVAEEGAATAGLSTPGRFIDTARAVTSDVERMRAVIPVAVLLLLAAAVVTLLELTRYLALRRAAEHALLWARGRSVTAAGGGSAVEAGAAAALGGLAGLALGAAAADGSASPLAITVTAGLIVIGAAMHAAFAVRASGPPRLAVARGRLRRALSPTAALLAGLAAGIAVWQLRLYGSPVIADADGGVGVDPVAAVAPTLALVAAVLLLLLVLPAAAHLLERRASRGPVERLLATRFVARRLPRAAAVIAVVALATGTIATAAFYSRTWDAAFEQTSAVRAGGQVQVIAGRGGFSAGDQDQVAGVAGVAEVFPVQLEPLQLSDGAGSLVAADMAALTALPAAARTLVDPLALAETLEVSVPAPEVPADVSEISLETTVAGFSRAPGITLVVIDEGGTLRRVPGIVDALPSDAEQRLRAQFTLPPHVAEGVRHLAAIDIVIDEDAIVGAEARFGPPAFASGPAATGAPLFSGIEWGARVGGVIAPPDPLPGGGFRAVPGVTDVRLAPTGGSAGAVTEPPVAVSTALADRYGLAVGDRLSFGIERIARYTGVVAAIVPAIPSATDPVALFIDLTVLQIDALLAPRGVVAPSSLWVAAADPELAARAIRQEVAPSAVIRTADALAAREIVGATVGMMWAVAGASALLALITAAAVAGAERRARRDELAVLRALGLSPAQQGRIRAREWIVVGLAGVGVGLLAGGAVAALTVPELARAAIPGEGTGGGMSLRVDVWGLAAGVAILLGSCSAVIIGVVAAVRHDARRMTRDEAAR
jgi:hypothetical protein